MVKNIFIFISMLLMLSCNKHYFFSKDNGSIFYKNFSDTIVDVSQCDFQSFEKINVTSFNLEGVDVKNHTKSIDIEMFRKLFTIQEDAFNEFHRKKDGNSFLGDIREDTTNNRVVITPYGKVSLCDGIDSYIVLMYYPDVSNEFNKHLILYNVKQNKLCSIVELVFLIGTQEGIYNSKAHILSNKTIEQIKYPGIFLLNQETLDYLNLNPDLYDKSKFESYTFSHYKIDNEGYVRLVN